MKFPILAIIFLFAFNCHAKKTDSTESDSTDGSTESPSTSSISLANIKKSLKLTNKDETYLKNTFDISTMELIEPKSESDIAQQKFCIVKSQLKDKTDSVRIKISKPSGVKTWYNPDQERSFCVSDLKPEQSNNKLIPIEYHVSKEFQNKPRISKFYTEQSQVVPLKNQNGFVILTSQNYVNSESLLEWYNSKKDSLELKELEKNLKMFFSQMHAALTSLLDKKFLYTDFKPENIIVNKNNKKGSAFLINLNSVVSLGKANKLEKICVITPEFFPPVQGVTDSNKLAVGYVKTEGAKSINRMLSWQFCMAIFSLVCKEFDEKKSQFKDRVIFDKWKNENASLNKYFKCPSSKISTSLNDLFDNCLYKKSNHKSLITFEKIIEHEWFENKN
ncbi:unnamed protein product [Brachionus calyciflorus]|uniref:Protein kinase domain-containing protein n=1 Tax=Brachionus calyciflorus TaxID=104777 RepID=A0A814CBY3_9BILA|nr:unnamed protein product [Brachionus calyciflorus]